MAFFLGCPDWIDLFSFVPFGTCVAVHGPLGCCDCIPVFVVDAIV